LSKNHPSIFLATQSKPTIEICQLMLFVCSLLAIKNLQNHFIVEFRISLFGEISLAGKGLLHVHAPNVMASGIE
jgi:hypothetical protein